MAESSRFTWVQTHKDIVQYLKNMKDRQPELISVLEKAGIEGFNDQDSNGQTIKLAEIDPFSFFFYIYKYGDVKRLKTLQNIAQSLHLPIPNDTHGVPSANPLSVRVFPYKATRINDEINRLWSFFFKAIEHQLTDEDFRDVLQILGMAKPKLTEALFMVDPEYYLCINGQTRPYLREIIGIDPKFSTYSEYVEILQKVRGKSDMQFPEFSYGAWKWNTKENKDSPNQIEQPNNSRKFWSFSAGENSKMWDEFYKDGYMGIGFVVLGDLAQYESKAAIEKKLREAAGTDSPKTNNSTANWEFKAVMKPGDIVIVKKGRQTLLGYGVITSDYYFDQTKDHYQKCRKVKWLGRGVWKNKSSTQLQVKTLTDITKYNSDRSDCTFYYEELLRDMNVELPLVVPGFGVISVPEPTEKTVPSTMHSLNTILFGPPGTGKTYNSINMAVEITDPGFMSSINDKETERDLIRERYKALVKDGRIVFSTFHQSMCYEDFIEGIKPITNEDQQNSLTYEVVPGILKSLCDRAALSDDNNFEQSYAKLIAELASSEDDYMKIKTPSGKEFGISLNSNNNLNLHLGVEFKQNACLTKEIMIKHILGKDIPVYFRGYYQGVIALLKADYGLKTNANPTTNYVLIIDEINRGNVSQIFGELITLIEKDKRAGMKEDLEVTLPYSKEKFSVPPNLYIIGTMNTADRSVEALDTALRRRFSFREIVPKYDLLESRNVEGINIGKLLKTINDRIEALLDKDHAIGHSYFLNAGNDLGNLKDVFFNEIIPLLQEYFYGNFGRIELVLGRGFVQAESISSGIFAHSSPNNNNVTDIEQFKLFRPERMTDESFLKALKTLLKEIDEPTQD